MHANKWKCKHDNPKPMGFSEIYGMSEVHSNISLPKDMRETSNKQPNFTPKATKKKKEEEENKNPKISRRKEITKTRAEINIKERKEMIANIRKKKKKKLKSGSVRS